MKLILSYLDLSWRRTIDNWLIKAINAFWLLELISFNFSFIFCEELSNIPGSGIWWCKAQLWMIQHTICWHLIWKKTTLRTWQEVEGLSIWEGAITCPITSIHSRSIAACNFLKQYYHWNFAEYLEKWTYSLLSN